jgi:Rrf2 family protein
MNITFTRRTDLAIAALIALAEAGGRLNGSELAEDIGTTPSFLPQVMSALVHSGWVSSERGPGGGYLLTDSAYQARLLEVIEASEGPTDNGRCVLRATPCPGPETCPFHEIWTEARRVLMEGFDETLVLNHRDQGDRV